MADPTRFDPATVAFGGLCADREEWDRIAKLGELAADVTPHVLRHSFASLAADLGYSEPTIAALIGHKGQSITSRYVHAADAVARRAAELMGEAAPVADVIPLWAAG